MKELRIFRLIILAIALLFAFARAGQYFFSFAIEYPALQSSAKMTQYQPNTGLDLPIRHMGKATETRFNSLQLPAMPFTGVLLCCFIAVVLSLLLPQLVAFVTAPHPPGRRLAMFGVLRL